MPNRWPKVAPGSNKARVPPTAQKTTSATAQPAHLANANEARLPLSIAPTGVPALGCCGNTSRGTVRVVLTSGAAGKVGPLPRPLVSVLVSVTSTSFRLRFELPLEFPERIE